MIENSGEVDILAFTLMGASSKRNAVDKIGFFGSGNKYAIANLLRRGIKFSIYSGVNEIKVYTKTVKHRETDFENIVFETDGVPFSTSLTTAMGPKWEAWYIMRELYCNAVDEGGVQVKITDDAEQHMAGEYGKTRVYIELVDELFDVINHWNAYFTADRKDLIAHIKEDTSKLFETVPECKVYHKYDEKFRIYRKGVLVYVGEEKSVFDYDLFTAEINEERILSNIYDAKRKLGVSIGAGGDAPLLKKIMQGMDKFNRHNLTNAESQMYFHYSIGRNKENWKGAVEGLTLVNEHRKSSYTDALEANDSMLVNADISYALAEIGAGSKTLGVPTKGLSHSFRETLITQEQQALLDKAYEFLVTADFEFGTIRVQPVQFDDYAIAGMADLQGNLIYIGQACFDKGLKFTVSCLMEEYAHIKSRQGDETRAFQNYLIDKWLCEIEKRLEINL